MISEQLRLEFRRDCAELIKDINGSPGGMHAAIEGYLAGRKARDAHWTDKHIHQIGNEFYAFDEGGLELGRFATHDEARDRLVVHAAQLNMAPALQPVEREAWAWEECGTTWLNGEYECLGWTPRLTLYKPAPDDDRRNIRKVMVRELPDA